jgi:hypothetical protein
VNGRRWPLPVRALLLVLFATLAYAFCRRSSASGSAAPSRHDTEALDRDPLDCRCGD